MKITAAVPILTLLMLPRLSGAADLRDVGKALLDRNWGGAKAAILLLPENTPAETALKLRLLVGGKLHLDYMEGADFFGKVASFTRHAPHAADFYRRDLRYREELAEGLLRELPEVVEEQSKTREAVRRTLESIPEEKRSEGKAAPSAHPAVQ